MRLGKLNFNRESFPELHKLPLPVKKSVSSHTASQVSDTLSGTNSFHFACVAPT